MKKTLFWATSVIAVGAVLSLVFGIINKPSAEKTIAVNGACTTTVPRDRVAITLRVTTLAPTTVESMKMATNQMSEITASLKSMPVELQTTQFNSYEKTEWNRDLQKSVNLGMETTIALEVSANDITTLETVLTKFAGKENVFTENLRMYTSEQKIQPALEECLGVAVENARTRANALAAGDGKSAGKLLSVSYGAPTTNDVYPTNLRLAKAAMVESSAFDASGTLASKDTELTVTISAIFEIK